MKNFQITEWCPIKQRHVSWIGEFASIGEAYAAIEYFGRVEALA